MGDRTVRKATGVLRSCFVFQGERESFREGKKGERAMRGERFREGKGRRERERREGEF